MQTVDSTAIAALDYDPATRVLEVRFITGGDYRYFDVPGDVAEAFLAAESKGRFFHEAVLDRFAFERRR